MKKEYIVLIGLPASGKSTHINDILATYPDATIISRDNIVMKYAKQDGITYNEAFFKYGKEIDVDFKAEMDKIRQEKPNVVINDRTNLTTKSRDSFSKFFKDQKYRIIYIFFEKPKTDVQRYIWECRLNGRKGKVIPKETLDNMEEMYVDYVETDAKVQPDIVIKIDSWGK